MQKLILGIIAVALLQIGFLTYVTSDGSDEMLALNNRQPATTVTGDYQLSDDSFVIDTSADSEGAFSDGADRIDTVRPTWKSIRAETSARRKSYIGGGSRSLRKNNRQPQMREPFVPEQVIITYASYKPYKFVDREREPEGNVQFVNRPEIVAEPPVARIQKAQKRSFLAGALPIIKKPYEWIKALGSKLK